MNEIDRGMHVVNGVLQRATLTGGVFFEIQKGLNIIKKGSEELEKLKEKNEELLKAHSTIKAYIVEEDIKKT